MVRVRVMCLIYEPGVVRISVSVSVRVRVRAWSG